MKTRFAFVFSGLLAIIAAPLPAFVDFDITKIGSKVDPTSASGETWNYYWIDCPNLPLVKASGVPDGAEHQYRFEGVCSHLLVHSSSSTSSAFGVEYYSDNKKTKDNVGAGAVTAGAEFDPSTGSYAESFKVTEGGSTHTLKATFKCSADPVTQNGECARIALSSDPDLFLGYINAATALGRPLLKGHATLAQATTLSKSSGSQSGGSNTPPPPPPKPVTGGTGGTKRATLPAQGTQTLPAGGPAVSLPRQEQPQRAASTGGISGRETAQACGLTVPYLEPAAPVVEAAGGAVKQGDTYRVICRFQPSTKSIEWPSCDAQTKSKVEGYRRQLEYSANNVYSGMLDVDGITVRVTASPPGGGAGFEIEQLWYQKTAGNVSLVCKMDNMLQPYVEGSPRYLESSFALTAGPRVEGRPSIGAADLPPRGQGGLARAAIAGNTSAGSQLPAVQGQAGASTAVNRALNPQPDVPNPGPPEQFSRDRLPAVQQGTGAAITSSARFSFPKIEPASSKILGDVLSRLGEPVTLPQAESALQNSVVAALKGNDLALAKSNWLKLVSGIGGLSGDEDIMALIQYVLRQSYMEANKELQAIADRVAYFNDLKKGVRDQMSRARDEIRRVANPQIGIRLQPVSIRTAYEAGAEPVALGKFEMKSAEEWEKEIENWERALQSAGDDAQLANIDMQNYLQKHQQILQQISQISKMLHDTAMSVIRKIN